MNKVLYLATSRKTKGGITSVLNTYKQCLFWEKYNIRWIETHIDRNIFAKMLFSLGGLVNFLFIVWSYDLVHIHTGEINSMKRKYIFFKIARWLNKKTIVHLHIGNQIDSYEHNKICQNMVKNADAIIVLSNELKNKIHELFFVDESKIYVIHNPCVPVENVQYLMNSKVILYAGRLDYNKGYHILLEAFTKIASKYPDWKIVIAGNGEIDKAIQIATKNKILNQVAFRGWITGDEKAHVFREAAFLCLPSYAEGFSMTVLEAWAYSLPVVCTPVGGLRDIVCDGVNALLFESGNAMQLAEQLERMITNPSLRKSIAEKSHELASSMFDIQTIGEQIDCLYKFLIHPE